MDIESMHAVDRAMGPGRFDDELMPYRVELKLTPLVQDTGSRMHRLVPDPDGIAVVLRGDAQLLAERSDWGRPEHKLVWLTGTSGDPSLRGEVAT